MDDHRSRCELEPVECEYYEVGCKVDLVRKDFESHMEDNRMVDIHLTLLSGAFKVKQKQLDECQRERDKYRRMLHETSLKFLETRKENKHKHDKPIKLREEETFQMNNYSLYKLTSKVWHSLSFYYLGNYKFCLAVYANGKGAGAGTHVSVELLQMKGEHDDKLRWNKRAQYQYPPYSISIQMIAQSEKAQVPEKEASFHICTTCIAQQPPPEDLRVFKNGNGNAVSEDKFIDHQSAEQVMVLNDTIELRITLH